MKKNDEKTPEIKAGPWAFILGALSVAAWAVAATWGDKPFDLIRFLGGMAAYAFLGFLVFSPGYVAGGLTAGEKNWVSRLLYVLGLIAVDGGLIWYIFFR